MSDYNPFERNEEGYDLIMAEIFYVLTNINKKWVSEELNSEAKITKVIFRGEAPWRRMDIEVLETVNGRAFTSRTIESEFIEHYHPEGVPMYDAHNYFKKVERFYGIEWVEEI